MSHRSCQADSIDLLKLLTGLRSALEGGVEIVSVKVFQRGFSWVRKFGGWNSECRTYPRALRADVGGMVNSLRLIRLLRLSVSRGRFRYGAVGVGIKEKPFVRTSRCCSVRDRLLSFMMRSSRSSSLWRSFLFLARLFLCLVVWQIGGGGCAAGTVAVVRGRFRRMEEPGGVCWGSSDMFCPGAVRCYMLLPNRAE